MRKCEPERASVLSKVAQLDWKIINRYFRIDLTFCYTAIL